MLPLVDYLRSLIVLMSILHCDKEQVIDWLDDALIDEETHDNLKNRVSQFSSIVASG
jgi:hypothetical protein